MNIDDMIKRAEAEKKAADGRLRAAADARSAAIRSDDSQAAANAADAYAAAAQAVNDAADKLANYRHEKRADEIVDRLATIAVPAAASPWTAGGESRAYDRVARVTSETRTYHPGTDRTGAAFIADVVANSLFGDPTARERLARHMSEERVERGEYATRAVGTSAFAGLTVPQYLTDLYAPATAALRPFANECCTLHPLPAEGMSVEISRITTASSVALQSSQNSAVSETNMDDTQLSVAVQTAAGQQTVSRQAVERGTSIEDAVLGDLFRRYATTLDSTLINQATTGLDAVAQGTTYTDASPTTAELWPKLFASQNNVEAALLAQAFPTHHVMHPRRWNWICSQVGSTWPSVGSAALPPQLFAQVLTNEYGAGTRAVLNNGMKVVTDANITTTAGGGTEDVIYTTAQAECHLWEDPAAPVFIRAEQPNAGTLGVLLVVYGYFAYTFSRYANAAGKITGTGVVAPTFA